MNKEKLLFFLNLKENQVINKTTIKGVPWIGVLLFFFITLCELICKIPVFSSPNIIFLSFFIASDVLFFLAKRRIKNVVYERIFILLSLVSWSMHCLYGYLVFSIYGRVKYGTFIIGIPHYITLALTITYGIIILILNYKFYQDLKTKSIKQQKQKLDKINTISTIITIPLLISPMVFVRLMRDMPYNTLGFAFFLFMCAAFLLCCTIIPFVIIVKKKNVATWFDND